MQVFILGEAFRPGSYTLSSLSTITHALFAGGGVNINGSLRNIQLKRQGKLIASLDIYDLLLKGDTSNDVRLKSGDVVFIPTIKKRATISGQVIRPAIYELTEQETFADLVAMAGGVSADAYPEAVRVRRFNSSNLQTTVNLNLSQADVLAMSVNNGDAVTVPLASENVTGSIELEGAAVHPGKYQWKKSLYISDIISNVEADLLAITDLHYGLVVRQKDASRRIEVLQFSPIDVINNPQSAKDIALKVNDRVLIFNNLPFPNVVKSEIDASLYQTEDEFEFQHQQQVIALAEQNPGSRLVLLPPIEKQLKREVPEGSLAPILKIGGEVNYPGTYPLPANTDLSDAINAAGGLSESAYMEYAELVRTTITNNGPISNYQSINLRDLISKKQSDITLQAKDQLIIQKKPSWNEKRTITLHGEVKFPGTYSFNAGETLANVIVRAGGLTDRAFVQGAVFTREKERRKQQKQIERLAKDMQKTLAIQSLGNDKNSGLSSSFSDKLEIINAMKEIEAPGRIVIDFAGIIDGDLQADFILEAGDNLYIPTKSNAVAVVGMVQFESTHFYKDNLSMDDYLALSGNLKEQADEGRIYVIKADGAVKIPQDDNWFTASMETTIQPGDTIVVPLDSGYMTNLTLWSTATQIIYNTAVAIAAISGL